MQLQCTMRFSAAYRNGDPARTHLPHRGGHRHMIAHVRAGSGDASGASRPASSSATQVNTVMSCPFAVMSSEFSAISFSRTGHPVVSRMFLHTSLPPRTLADNIAPVKQPIFIQTNFFTHSHILFPDESFLKGGLRLTEQVGENFFSKKLSPRITFLQLPVRLQHRCRWPCGRSRGRSGGSHRRCSCR